MEFPTLGSHCHEKSCKRLDFLPMLCDACGHTFCSEHLFFTRHSCPQAHVKDNQVPQCPLCKKPVPVKPGESADVKVGRHIDDDCQSDPAQEHRGKVYKNRCSFKSCKTRELVPFRCSKCRKNFCIKHRHETDHSCSKTQNQRNHSNAAEAAMARQSHNQQRSPFPVHTGKDLKHAQNGLSDGDALAMALRMSQQQEPHAPQVDAATAQEAADAALAAQLHAEELEQRNARLSNRQQQQQGAESGGNSSCRIS